MMAFDQMDQLERVETVEMLAARLDAQLRDATPQEIIRVAAETFGDRLALVSSFGAESAVLLHMVAEVRRDLPVLFLDTGMLFGQTLDYRKRLAADFRLTDVRDLRPSFEDLAARRSRIGAAQDRHRRLLQYPQGRSAGVGARGVRRLDDRPQALPRR